MTAVSRSFEFQPIAEISVIHCCPERGVSLHYHDLKIRDVKRLIACAVACLALLGLGLSFRSLVEPIVNGLTTRRTEEYWALMFGLAFGAIICGLMAVRYFRTSPAQDAEYLDRSVREGRDLPPQFGPNLLDTSNPDFEVRTLEYWRRNRAARLKD